MMFLLFRSCLTAAVTLGLVLCSVAVSEDSSAKKETSPNFIVIFCDDMGYADIGPFGAEGYQTPHLDQMAAEGMLFTDFYVGRSFCSPSRAALMTGCIPTRVGVGGNFGPRSKNGLNPEEETIADILKSKGYATACFGKWHLGHQPAFLPPNQGFDEYFGLPYSNDMWPFHPGVRHLPLEERLKRWPNLPLYEGLEVVNEAVQPEDQVQLTTQLTERAVDFIERNREKPFFLYLPNPQPHVPLFVSEKFEGETARGLYGDVISEIDWQVGRIFETLKATDIDDNTLVVFNSDNGPWLSYGDHAGSAKPLREGKGSNFEGGFRVSCLMRWPGEIPAGAVCREVAGTIDLLPTIANLAEAPLPERKIDGQDISELMRGSDNATSPHEVFYHYDGKNRLVALRKGKWKLMFSQKYGSPVPGKGGIPGGKSIPHQLELSLFDLESDIGETTNLADQHPEVVEELQGYAEEMRKDLGDGEDVGPGRRPLGQL
ncbi:Arylsulfatase [Thalassoglobus neptunius]|uniref:Arylsulfatase n=1 Tax=Thalassoglobus neptunius TaxID=1938619 RepID=A0A5C5X585_9PLAN|nr:sulfatase [Thalassoglobus neptunius]TWT58277.1 Arylsulfatase [Thalassoglobus neptunius]